MTTKALRTCWDWCSQDHEHSYSSQPFRQLGTGVRIDPEERRILEAQTGQKFHDRSDLNRWLQRTGRRVEETGEPNQRILKEALQGAPEPQWRPDPRKPIDLGVMER